MAGSSSGITSANPAEAIEDGRKKLTWNLGSSPGYQMNAGTTRHQTFQVVATLGWGTCLNLAWIIARPNSIGYVSTGDTAPVQSATLFDVLATSGNSTVKARLGYTNDGQVIIISYQTL